jgi:hypothetical protein
MYVLPFDVFKRRGSNMSDPKYPVIDPNDLVGSDDDDIKTNLQNGLSDQALRAISLLIATLINKNNKEIKKFEDLNNETYVIMDFIKNGKD